MELVEYLGLEAVVASAEMRQVLELLKRVASSEAAILIEGESGVGKEIAARAIHALSPRARKPWVDLSCGALPEHLVESELFGYERGAFSGAQTAKPGLFELAHTGTLFLDEVGELDARMQVKLLRVLDGVPYYRLGGTRKVGVDVRVVTATNSDLAAAVSSGLFRRDLFHRVAQLRIRVPALRNRLADIIPLAEYFLAKQHRATLLDDSARAALLSHSWPGNVRELRNVMTHAALLAEPGRAITAADLHLPELAPPASDNLGDLERQAILRVLQAVDGHREQAAERLGISRRTLTRRLKELEAADRSSWRQRNEYTNSR
jgi:transcriptional regulator with PAS, ATPase and Fis domain